MTKVILGIVAALVLVGVVIRRRRIAYDRAHAVHGPGKHGWALPGGGRSVQVDAQPEFRGPSNHVCGLYPFSVGSTMHLVGTVLGRHLGGRGMVCGDPISWFVAKLIRNPSGFVLGRPGVGKSSLLRRIVALLPRRGVIPMVLSDLKPDYVKLIRRLKGQVIEVGRGRGHVNPMDLGPLAAKLHQLPDRARGIALADLRGRRLNVIAGLCELALGARLDTHESNVLSAALSVWDKRNPGKVGLIGDVRAIVEEAPLELRSAANARRSDDRYWQRVERLLDALVALSGESEVFGDVFARHTTNPMELEKPMVFDLSSFEGLDRRLQAGVQLVCWSYGSAGVHAAKVLAAAGLAPQRHYLLVMDELWRTLRAAAFMVDRVDELTRLNRTLGIGQLLCTHTMDDLNLDGRDGPLTKQAWGLVGRSEMVYLGGLTQGEMGNLDEVYALSESERDMLTAWSVEGRVNPETNKVDEMPGQGNFLMKIGKQTGVAFHVDFTECEKEPSNTNEAWTTAMGQDGNEADENALETEEDIGRAAELNELLETQGVRY